MSGEPKPVPRRKLSTLGARLALSVGALVVFGLALELGLWAVGLLPTLRAGLTEPPRTDASWDLVFAGDSVTYGLDLPASASYPAQLGRRPALRDSGGEIYNLAQPGADLAGMRDQIEEFTQRTAAPRPIIDFRGSRRRGGRPNCASS